MGRRSAKLGGSSFSAFERCTEWREKGKRRSCSSREEQDGDGRSRREFHGPDTRITFLEMSESSESGSPREKGCRASFSSELTLKAVLVATSRSTYRKNFEEK